jgi:hypothetical protein
MMTKETMRDKVAELRRMIIDTYLALQRLEAGFA